jgi:hypothetical protein
MAPNNAPVALQSVTKTAQIQSFRVVLDWPSNLAMTVSALESALNPQLPAPGRLLRWAVVAVAARQLTCEGVYQRTF